MQAVVARAVEQTAHGNGLVFGEMDFFEQSCEELGVFVKAVAGATFLYREAAVAEEIDVVV